MVSASLRRQFANHFHTEESQISYSAIIIVRYSRTAEYEGISCRRSDTSTWDSKISILQRSLSIVQHPGILYILLTTLLFTVSESGVATFGAVNDLFGTMVRESFL